MQVCDLCQQTNESGELVVFRTADGQTLCEECADLEKEVDAILRQMARKYPCWGIEAGLPADSLESS